MATDPFLKIWAPMANDIATSTHLDPAVILGIIDIETGHGTRVLGNNIFGISPSGPRGQYVAQYPDVETARDTFIDLINKRYPNVAQGRTPAEQAQLLVRGGYNTVNPNWASIVTRSAMNAGSQLGYQNPSPAAQPAAASPAPAAAPAAAPAPPPAASARERNQQALQGQSDAIGAEQTAPAAPAQPDQRSGGAGGSARERNQQAVQQRSDAIPADTTQPPPPSEPSPGPTGPIDWTSIGPEGSVGSGTTPPAVGRIIDAARQGWNNTEPALTPKGEAAVGPVGSFVSSAILDNPRRALNALMAGGAAGVMEATAPIAVGPEGGQDAGPGWGARLGRDINQMIAVAPIAGMEPNAVRSPNALATPYPEIPPGGWRFRPEGTPDPAPPPPPSPAFVPPGTPAPPPPPPVAPEFIPPGTRLSPPAEAGAPAGGPQPGMGGGGAQPGMGGPQPQAAGAAPTPTAMAVLTPEQSAAYGSMADKQWVWSSQEPGIRDTTQYIPGETISTAQREQTANAAREQKTQRNISPAAQQEEEQFLHAQSEFRKDHFQQTAGNDVLQHTAMKNADENIEAGLTKAFNAGGKVDTAPIVSAVADELRGSAGELPPLKSAMKQLTDALEGKTDPRDVYKVRRLINYMQSKTGKAENLGYGDHDVQAALVRVKQAVDRQMEPAAPGFGAAMSDYSAAQRAIEANEYLQKEEPKLYDKNGRMQYSRFHNFMVRMVMQRDPNVAPNPAQSVSQAQFERLQGIHDSLKRAASAEDLARAKGSDSAPNLMDIAKEALSGLPGQIAAGVVGHAALGPFGAAAAPVVKAGIGAMVSRRGQARATTKMRNLLYPEGTTSPPRPPNQLTP